MTALATPAFHDSSANREVDKPNRQVAAVKSRTTFMCVIPMDGSAGKAARRSPRLLRSPRKMGRADGSALSAGRFCF